MPIEPVDQAGEVGDEPVVASTDELSAAPGSLDPSFGALCLDTSARFTVAGAVRAQLLPDGKLLAAANVIATDTGASELALVRFLASGAVDTSFGSAGYVRTSFGDDTVYVSLEGLALAPDGKIVLAGSRDFIVVDAAGARSQPTVIIAARFTSNGALDPSFGTGGKAQAAVFGKTDRAAALLVQPDGKVLIGGQARLNI
ncbi:MAG TPA: hypothetical protein VK509_25530, partial [Polyangiales bacterium]|nr:hypothetical protein [Polyangiales bacterium]